VCVESGRVGDVGEQVVEVSGPGLVVAEEAEGAERPAVVGALRGGAEDVRGGVAEEDGAVASRGLRPGEAVVSGAGEEAKAVERAVAEDAADVAAVRYPESRPMTSCRINMRGLAVLSLTMFSKKRAPRTAAVLAPKVCLIG